MRILCLTSVDATTTDGAAVHIRGTCKALTSAGHEVCLAHPTGIGQSSLQATWLGRSEALLWPQIRGGWRLFQLHLQWRLPFLIRVWRPDVIYARMTPSPRIARAIGRTKIPMVLEVNGADALTNPKFGDFAATARLILADCTELADQLVSGLPALASKIGTHDTFVTDGDRFHQRDRAECCQALGLRQEVFRLLHVSSFQDWHDFRTMLLAARQVAQVSAREVELVLVGSGPRMAQIKKMAAELAGVVTLRFTGAVTHDDVALYIGAADLTLDSLTRAKLVSSKNLGACKIYEYAASDRPVITAVTEAFQAPEWARQGLYLIPPEDEQALAAAILTVMRDPEAYAKRAVQAGAHVRRNHTWTAATETTLQHLRKLIATPERP